MWFKSRLTIPAIAAISFWLIVGTTPTHADLGDQLFKLLSNDGAENDYFGSSIAIDNGIVAVGAYYDEDNGSTSGSAYLFDTTTGLQIAKLLPKDGEEDDDFGWAVAISGTTVIVGSPFSDDNGVDSGSA